MVDIPYGSGRRGQGTKAQSMSVTFPSDADSVPTSSPTGSSATDRSGSITLGGTAQNAMAVNTSRKEWTFTNTSDTVMYVSAAATATAANGIPVYPDETVEGNETNAISVLCATTGKTFSAWER